METDRNMSEPSGRPTPEEASAALREVDQAQASLASIPPWWYFVSLAALVAVVPVIIFAPATTVGILLTLVGLVVWAALFGLTIGMYIRKLGVVPRLSTAPPRLVLPPAIGALAITICAAVLALVHDQDWIWFVASGAVGGMILIMRVMIGHYARKTP